MLRWFMKEPEVQLDKFRPHWGVAIFVKPLDEDHAFLQTWALAQLMAWAILDQKPGKRPPKGTPSKRRIRTRSAKQAGHITLAHLLDRRLKRNTKNDSSELKLMLSLFLQCGGFAGCFKSWGEQDLFYDIKHAERDLGYVYRIVRYLCRYHKHHGEDANYTIETAKAFVKLSAHEGKMTYRSSKIGQIWEKYKNSAPYIFAIYRHYNRSIAKADDVDQIVDWLERFSSKKNRLIRLVGVAAFAADVLLGKARNVRRSDFKECERVEPPLPPFSAHEWNIITATDRQAPIP